ncbi:MAG: hypothetical protein ACLTMP_10275 [Eggerthella lenta]
MIVGACDRRHLHAARRARCPRSSARDPLQAGNWFVKFFGKSQDEIDGMPKDDEDEE